MKRFATVFLILCLALSACAGESPTEEHTILTATPLVQIAAEEGAATRLLPTREGILALWGRSKGFAASYVSPGKSVLIEDLCEGEGDFAEAGFLETETGKGLLATRDSAFYLLLTGRGAEARPFDEDILFTGVLYRDEGLICRKGGLLLLLPADLEAPLVLTDTAAFPDYGGVLTVSPDGRRVWCLKENDKMGCTGLFAFCPGQTRADREISLRFDGALAASGERVLLWRRDGESTVFTLLDLATEEALSATVPAVPDRVALSPEGERFALWDAAQERAFLYDLTGAEAGRLSTGDLGTVTALAFGADGTLYAALRKGGVEVLTTLAKT